MSTATIYCLVDPSNMEVRYIGKTIRPLARRLMEHLAFVQYENNDRERWVNGLLQMCVLPLIKTIAVVDNDEWEHWEKYYIKLYRNHGANLLNKHEGGRLMKNS